MRITHSNLSDKVKNILRKKIIEQELPPGMHLKEDKIAEELGVSRTPVREALRTLIEAGLVKEIPRKGTYVIELTKSDVEEVYTIRSVLEGLATRLATPFFSNDELKFIDKAFTEVEDKLKSNDFQLFLEVDTEFHDTIIEKNLNGRLKVLLGGVHDQIMIFRNWHASQSLDEAFLAMREHRMILDALKNQDSFLAEKKMVEHIERVKQHLLQNYPFCG